MSAIDFSKAQIGLKCVLWGVVIYVVATIISMVFGGHPTITATVRALGIVALILTAIGECLCLRVPLSMPGVGFVYGAVCCSVLALAFIASLFFWDPVVTFENLLPMWGAALMAAALFSLGDILFNFFLKSLARYVDDEQNARRAGALIMLKFITLGMVFAALFLFFKVAGIAVTILFLTALIWALIIYQYIGLLSGLSYSLLAASRRSFAAAREETEDEEADKGGAESDNPFESFGK